MSQANDSYITVAARREPWRVEYVAPALSRNGELHAPLGPYGTVSMRFVPDGTRFRVHSRFAQGGSWLGAFRFKAESGFTYSRATVAEPTYLGNGSSPDCLREIWSGGPGVDLEASRVSFCRRSYVTFEAVVRRPVRL